jgi:hypothetical protein
VSSYATAAVGGAAMITGSPSMMIAQHTVRFISYLPLRTKLKQSVSECPAEHYYEGTFCYLVMFAVLYWAFKLILPKVGKGLNKIEAACSKCEAASSSSVIVLCNAVYLAGLA